ncbi:SsrA-binding protein SmpB [Candidatus Saccharibacteria bacterium]|nr:SsrA-binding protein SmpB [Candidatus Saccharibacteria bacterium]
MSKKKQQNTGKIQNRRARFDYSLQDEYIAGLVLSGAETKSLRRGHGHLRGAYVTNKGSEFYLTNATITGDSSINIPEEDQTRSRKLLLKQKEINELLSAKQQGMTIVPIELLTKGRYIKVKISLGKGKKQYDKREVIKKRDHDRETSASLKFRS